MKRADVAAPDLFVYLKALLLGFVLAEVIQISSILGVSLDRLLTPLGEGVKLAIIGLYTTVTVAYLLSRGAVRHCSRLWSSKRIDLLGALALGMGCNVVAAPYLQTAHQRVERLDGMWGAAILAFAVLPMLTTLLRAWRASGASPVEHRYFLGDEEVSHADQDYLKRDEEAKAFAATVLQSSRGAGLVFGLDGPWGVGKSSFMKLAERHWQARKPKDYILFRFEPLRYAADTDLSERFAQELLAVIQREVFAPEFLRALARYSKFLKGKAEVSLLGIKFSFEPGTETLEDLLQEVDNVLGNLGKHLIVIVEDLDRLEDKLVNNVLFTVRRAFNLSNASYILCYDTDNLISGREEGAKAREFLEKFVNVKVNLFINAAMVRQFLRDGWSREPGFVENLPSDRSAALKGLLNDLALQLEGEDAAQYMLHIGNLRKVKRFINAVVAMRLERLDLSLTDFNRGDLIRLLLLNINYPAVFRRVYLEETEGRSGTVSLKWEGGKAGNSSLFATFVKDQEAPCAFLLRQLFDHPTLKLSDFTHSDRCSRACFNIAQQRNLEKFLDLIVTRSVPEPASTVTLYAQALERAWKDQAVEAILDGRGFELTKNEDTHLKFWDMLVARAINPGTADVEWLIDAIVSSLPRYSSVQVSDDSVRQRLLIMLVKLLDSMSWELTRKIPGRGAPEVGHKIFGVYGYQGSGILEKLLAPGDVLAWRDVLRFRLLCSPMERSGLYDLHESLVKYQHEIDLPRKADDTDAESVTKSLEVLRQMSQFLLARFEACFIHPRRNFLELVKSAPDELFMPSPLSAYQDSSDAMDMTLGERINCERHTVIVFVVEQLVGRSTKAENATLTPGCGVFDREGIRDTGNGATVMNDYMFNVCFNSSDHPDNRLHFLDFCLANLPQAGTMKAGDGLDGSLAELAFPESLAGALDLERFKRYWIDNRDPMRAAGYEQWDRVVATFGYQANYNYHLSGVYRALDRLVSKAPLAMPNDSDFTEL